MDHSWHQGNFRISANKIILTKMGLGVSNVQLSQTLIKLRWDDGNMVTALRHPVCVIALPIPATFEMSKISNQIKLSEQKLLKFHIKRYHPCVSASMLLLNSPPLLHHWKESHHWSLSWSSWWKQLWMCQWPAWCRTCWTDIQRLTESAHQQLEDSTGCHGH